MVGLGKMWAGKGGKGEKHREISTYFCLKRRCGKKSDIFPYSVS